MKKSGKIWMTVTLVLAMFAGICFPLTVHAADAEWRMMHGEQDALVIGTIQKVTEDGYFVEVVQALWCAQDTGKGRMIPIEEVPSEMVIKEIRYDYTYHGKEMPEAGDHIFISVDQKGDIWEQKWLGMEVSSTDITTMEFAKPENMRNSEYAWHLFVSSGGETTAFAFEGEEILYVDGEIVFEADKYREEMSQEEVTSEDTAAEASEEELTEDDAVSVSIIGGADGPTSIFLAGKLGRGVRTVGILAGAAVIIAVAAVIVVIIRRNSKKK